MKARRIAFIGIFSGIAFVLMLLELAIPIVPSFLKMDISDLPAIILSFAYGPFSGVCVCLIKNLLHLTVGHTAGIGELANFLMGSSFVLVSGFFYQKHRKPWSVIVGGILGALAMAVVCYPVNVFIAYPLYANIGFTQEVIMGMYRTILPSVKSFYDAVAIFNVPFTFVKGIIVSVLTFLIYRPLSILLKDENAKK